LNLGNIDTKHGKNPIGIQCFFDIVLKKDKVEIPEKFLDKKNNNLTEDTIQSFISINLALV